MYHSLFFNSGVLEIMITIALNVHFQEFVLTEVLTIFYRSLECMTKNMFTFKMETYPMTFFFIIRYLFKESYFSFKLYSSVMTLAFSRSRQE